MKNKLPGDYIAGFVDGEGCFVLTFRRDIKHNRPESPQYFYWKVDFVIVLRSDDINILEQIRDTLECGKISKSAEGSVRYQVSGIDNLYGKILPFFDKYGLRAKKRHDYMLWKEAIEIIKRNQNETGKRVSQKIWKGADLKRLSEIHRSMSDFKGGKYSHKWLDYDYTM